MSKVLETATVSMLPVPLQSQFGQIRPDLSEFKDQTAHTTCHDFSQGNYAVQIIIKAVEMKEKRKLKIYSTGATVYR